MHVDYYVNIFLPFTILLQWIKLLSKHTGAKDVPMKYIGHEKVCVSVCLAAKFDGIKGKPFIVFGAARRESKSLHDEYKRQCSVASSSNAWMEEELTLRWCDEVPGQFTFTRGFTRSRHILPIK